MSIFIKVFLSFFALLYGTVGLCEGHTSKGAVSIILIALLIAFEVLSCLV